MVESILVLLSGYVGIGAVFGPVFAWKGVGVVDPAAAEGTWGFRLLILPGAAIFWPLLAWRWWAASRSGNQ